MFCYKENRFVSQSRGKREDAGAQWIDTHPCGIAAQLELAHTLIRSGFSVCHREARITMYAMAAEQLSLCERLSSCTICAEMTAAIWMKAATRRRRQHGSLRRCRKETRSKNYFKIIAGCS